RWLGGSALALQQLQSFGDGAVASKLAELLDARRIGSARRRRDAGHAGGGGLRTLDPSHRAIGRGTGPGGGPAVGRSGSGGSLQLGQPLLGLAPARANRRQGFFEPRDLV